MSTLKRTILDHALRGDFGLFLHRCFVTLNPGATFRPNWHLEAIEISAQAHTAWRK